MASNNQNQPPALTWNKKVDDPTIVAIYRSVIIPLFWIIKKSPEPNVKYCTNTEYYAEHNHPTRTDIAMVVKMMPYHTGGTKLKVKYIEVEGNCRKITCYHWIVDVYDQTIVRASRRGYVKWWFVDTEVSQVRKFDSPFGWTRLYPLPI